MKFSIIIITIALSFLLLNSNKCYSQTDIKKPFTFSGYAELYYSYDFANPSNHEKPNFIYNYKRHNEFNVNLAMAKASYLQDNVRGNVAIMFGNYGQYNLSAEPNWAQFIYEANVGIKLSKKQNIWLDAGIMPSHIGFEGAIGSDNSTLTRSILAENSPYYETGLKLSFTNKKENMYAAFLILNGWQRIKKPDAFQRPSVGIQINYKPTSKLTLNYSNFIGTDKPDSINAIRTFHNLYAIYEPTNKINLTFGFDIGTDKYNTTSYAAWFSPVFIVKYAFNNKNNIAARIEYYKDEKQIIIVTNTNNGFETFGTSLNFYNQITDKILWRTEGKYYNSKDNIFTKNNTSTNSNFVLTTSLSIKF